MKYSLLVPCSLFLSLAVWAILSWPLPMHFFTAVPVSAHGGEEHAVRFMVPSDALQLLYYFQLVKEWVTGGTPLFYNLYEFNTGNDEERFIPGGYYVPFSLIYTVGALVGGQAFGMNLAGVVSLWISLLATWLLLRRYVQDELIVALFSVFALAMPFRWMQLMDASPAGYAMMWVPLMLLGLDLAIRDGKMLGGLLAGVSIMMAFFGDLHVFFFSCLLLPGWCVLAGIAEPRWNLPLGKRFAVSAKGLLPLALMMIVLVFAVSSQSASLDETHMGSGRDMREVAIFSPQKSGFLFWEEHGISNQVHVGKVLPLLLVVGSLAIIVAFVRNPRRQWRNMLFWLLLLVGMGGIAVLALGPHGMRHGGLYSLVREVVPHYAMVRQAGKIFTLMPSLLALGGALALYAVVQSLPRGDWWRRACIGLVGGGLIGGNLFLPTPTLTYLDTRQQAYQAVVDDAEKLGIDPRALVITLWPGDSHFSSIYQHYAIAHRIRMINGYTPAIDTEYFHDVFRRFESLNQGYLGDDQIENLFSRGIRHILVHEDIYPEKVAPFPVSFLLHTYMSHPRLAFLDQDGPVRAFRILDQPRLQMGDGQPQIETPPLFPARLFALDAVRRSGGILGHDEQASGSTLVALSESGESVTLPWTATPPAPNLHFLVRARGGGSVMASVHNIDGQEMIERDLLVDSNEWEWFRVEVPLLTFSQVALHLQHQHGHVELDMAMLTGGHWPFLAPGESLKLAAPLFFRAGYSDLNTNSVMFRALREDRRIVFYGPRMPLAPGRYTVDFQFTDDAPAGTQLGVLHVELDWNTKDGPVFDVMAGEELSFSLDVPRTLPLSFSFIYLGAGDLRIDQMVLTRQ